MHHNFLKNNISIYVLNKDSNYFKQREKWFVDRYHQIDIDYITDKTGLDAAEEAYHITNESFDLLNEQERNMLGDCRHNVSTGDIVKVEPKIKKPGTPSEYYLCKSVGWEKYSGNLINLLKHLMD